MQNFHNIEKSGFRKGEYVGYAHGPWRITRSWRGWLCSNGHQSFIRRTLAEISKGLDVTAEHMARATQDSPQ